MSTSRPTELRIATLKRRQRALAQPFRCPEDLVHELELVHRLRRAQASPRGRSLPLWPITRQAAHRQVGALMAAAGIDGPQACPRGLRHSYGVAAVTRRRAATDRRRGARARLARDDRDLHHRDRRGGARARRPRLDLTQRPGAQCAPHAIFSAIQF